MMNIFKYLSRIKQLERRGWYRNMRLGFTHPHGMMVFSKKDIFNISDEEWEKMFPV